MDKEEITTRIVNHLESLRQLKAIYNFKVCDTTIEIIDMNKKSHILKS